MFIDTLERLQLLLHSILQVAHNAIPPLCLYCRAVGDRSNHYGIVTMRTIFYLALGYLCSLMLIQLYILATREPFVRCGQWDKERETE